MSSRVTAIVVARNGAEHLPRTLAALAEQTLAPDAIIAVDCASTDGSAELLAAIGPTHLVSAGEELSFGTAIETAVRVTTPPTTDGELLWLLAQDSAPAPDALAALVAALETAPSVAVVGPKVMDWDEDHIMRAFGASMSQYGAAVPIVADELDQGQRDVLSDVMAVAPAGMLVRHRVWETLGGFDPALPVADDALDFCVRTRLAGHRVSLVPAARVSSAGDGIAGPATSSRGRVRRRRARLERSAQLHRRFAYAPALALPVHWLSLLPLAVVRAVIALLGKQPGLVLGEFAAAFRTMFSGIRTGGARRSIARTRSLKWAALAPLRVSPAEMRRRRALLREARVARARGARNEVGFFTTGGAWTVLGAAVLGLAILVPLFGAAFLGGGGISPLSATPAGLWQNVAYGWRDIGVGFVGAADPFAAVLAVLGSLTFWAPSLVLLVIWFAALPLAALGAWFAATRITERGSLRAVAAILWMLAPPFLSALADGRPAALIAHLLLPWLVFAAFAAPRSWSASATSSLLFAAVIACSPSLAVPLVVAWVVLLVTSGRGIFRVIGIPIPAVVLVLPLVWNQLARGAWLALIADPGIPQTAPPASVWQLLLGFPSGRFGGWDAAIGWLPFDGVTPQLLVPILLAPLAVLAIVGMLLRGFRVAAFSLGLALLGFATAFATTLVAVATAGDQVVPVWAGSALSVYWLGIIGAVVAGLGGISRLALLPAIAAVVLFAIAVTPLALAIPRHEAQVTAGSTRSLPAFVTAAASTDARAGTLTIIPQPDGGIRADLERGAGTTLDDQSTLASTDQFLSSEQRDLATLAGNLASRSGLDASADLDDRRIRFILLAPTATMPGAKATAEATTTARRAAASLDQNNLLVPVGRTEYGTLWRVDTDEKKAATATIPPHAGDWFGDVSLLVIAIVFGIALLLSIPTGVGREVPAGSRRRGIVVPASPVEESLVAGDPHESSGDDIVQPEGETALVVATPDPAPPLEPPATEVRDEVDAPDEVVVVDGSGTAVVEHHDRTDPAPADEPDATPAEDNEKGDDDGR
ncbi:glycosyltransferase [Glaciibacter flavus]|uniref:glycosyltransferase n=1 Tax=Orlajensenia flava TaxID=2565934 RepID=UPI003B006578